MQASTVRSLAAGIAGFIVYGGWAYYINEPYDMGVAAGMTQGTYSFVLTLSTTLLMEFLMDLFSTQKAQTALTVAATSLVTFATAYLIHVLVGTPEILLTILPGFLIGTVYTVTYVLTLKKAHY